MYINDRRISTLIKNGKIQLSDKIPESHLQVKKSLNRTYGFHYVAIEEDCYSEDYTEAVMELNWEKEERFDAWKTKLCAWFCSSWKIS